jgi:CheY-like chemotaxis protein
MASGPIDVLLVEDDPSDAELILRALRKLLPPRRILTLKDGAAALDLLLDSSRPDALASGLPRLIILDLKLPKVTGLEVLRQIKSHERTRCLPAIILTSSRSERDLRECYRSGANSYLVKPVAYEEFDQLLMEFGRYWLQHNVVPP